MFSNGAPRRASLAVLLHVPRGRALSSLPQRPTYTEDKLVAASFVFKGFFFKCVKSVSFFFLFGNFLVNFSFEGQRCLAVLSVFEIQKTTLTCGLCSFYGMDADVGLFLFIVDVELDVIG